MELSQLYYFKVVAELEHVTKAAQILNIAQPALTKSIHNLEKELDIKLFENKGRNIILTNWGKWLYDKILKPVEQINNIPLEIKNIKNDKCIYINLLSASTFVTSAIIEFKKVYKDVTFSVVQNKLMNADITIKTLINERHDNCFKEEIFLAVPKNHNLKEFKDLENEQLISLTGAKEFRSICDEYCIMQNIKPKISFESDNINSILNLILSGNGIGFWPEYTWGEINENITLKNFSDYKMYRYININLNNHIMHNKDIVLMFYNYLILCFKKKKILEIK